MSSKLPESSYSHVGSLVRSDLPRGRVVRQKSFGVFHSTRMFLRTLPRSPSRSQSSGTSSGSTKSAELSCVKKGSDHSLPEAWLDYEMRVKSSKQGH